MNKPCLSKKDADRKNRVAYFNADEINELAQKYGFEILEGSEPIESGDDTERVGGKKIVWNLVLQKK